MQKNRNEKMSHIQDSFGERSSESLNIFRAESLLECEEYFEKETRNKTENNTMNKLKSNTEEESIKNENSVNSTGSIVTDYLISTSTQGNKQEFLKNKSNFTGEKREFESEKINNHNNFDSQDSNSFSFNNLSSQNNDLNFIEKENLNIQTLQSNNSSEFLDFSLGSSPSLNSSQNSTDLTISPKRHKNSFLHLEDDHSSSEIKNEKNDHSLPSSIVFLQDLILSIENEDIAFDRNLLEEGESFLKNQKTDFDDSDDFVFTNHSEQITETKSIGPEITATGILNSRLSESNTNENYRDHSFNMFNNMSNLPVESGFTTANQNKIFIDPLKLKESRIHFGLSSQSNELFDFNDKNMIDSGFTTGDNKKIFVDLKNIPEVNNENIPLVNDKCNVKSPLRNLVLGTTGTSIETVNNILNDKEITKNNSDYPKSVKSVNNCIEENEIFKNGSGINMSRNTIQSTENNINHQDIKTENKSIDYPYKAIISNKKFPQHQPMRRYNIPEQGHSSKKTKDHLLLIETFAKVRDFFKKEDDEWIFTQFKWTWLYLFSKDECKGENLYQEIIDVMKLRLKYEHSVLRRIVEFDDVAGKFLILGIISFDKETIELFDGFYSVTAEIDVNIFNYLKKNNCTLGSKIFAFGSQILLKNPESIFEIGNRPVLKLNLNGIRVCSNDFKLGSARKVAFLNEIVSIHKDGGVISCLIVKIVRIIETKYLVALESYRNRVDDLEKEVEKIMEIAEKVGHQIEPTSIKTCQFTKALISDDSGECLLTWWQPPEIKVGEKYKLIYITPATGSMGIHISTSRKTYWEKIKE